MSKFLTAEWRKLAMANYVVDAEILKLYLPYKTELDVWNSNCYLSLVGFMFMNTKLGGIKIPGYTNFEEVNLRFYVRYNTGSEWKRGVVFIKEIVPKKMIAFIANTFYGEKYKALPMQHSWHQTNGKLIVNYSWQQQHWHQFTVEADAVAIAMQPGSEAEFIMEHYWGYTQKTKLKTGAYQVQHPSWLHYPVTEYKIAVDFALTYGTAFSFLNSMQPQSVFLAEGSAIQVVRGSTIT